MKDQLVKQFHWIIILYAGFGLFTVYEEKEAELVASQAQIPGLENNVNRLKRKLTQINQFREDLNKSKERVQAVVKQIETIQKQLPTDINDVEIQQLFSNMSDELRIVEPNTQPLEEINNGFYFSKNFKYSGKGTFLQFLILVEKLEVLASKDRILNVKDLSFRINEAADKRSRFTILEFETAIESFRYNPDHKEGN
jgi:Tfp pilus assembly protein PilO